MKKMLILSLTALLALSSCGTYTGAGAYTGAQFGSIIGSAVGGLTGGWRGSDMGTLIGMAGGAAVGAAIGAAADNASNQRYASRDERPMQRTNDGSGFDPEGRGDDRIMMDETSVQRTYAATPSALVIKNVEMVDASHDGQLVRGESAHIVFEIYNTSANPVYGVQPSVTELTGNKHIHISENILIECIQPQQTIRYTAQVKADNGLRNGEAVIRVAVFQAAREISSQSRQLRIQTLKKL